MLLSCQPYLKHSRSLNEDRSHVLPGARQIARKMTLSLWLVQHNVLVQELGGYAHYWLVEYVSNDYVFYLFLISVVDSVSTV